MKQLKDLYKDVLENGEERDTRTGLVYSVWDRKLKFDLSKGFPAVTSKKLYWRGVVGELLWFLSGSKCLEDLKYHTFGDACADKWTIWSDDCERWHESNSEYMSEMLYTYVGNLYPHQWRNFGYVEDFGGVDQIKNLIKRLKQESHRRDHIVMAWNPYDIEHDMMALRPCHLGWQCYVSSDNKLHLKWWQRSCDSFLGIPYNIASYALLTHLLAKWTGLKVGTLTADLGDVHIYDNHLDAMNTYLNNPTHNLPELILPEGCDSLDSTLDLTALDFKDSLSGYTHEGVVKAPLSVG